MAAFGVSDLKLDEESRESSAGQCVDQGLNGEREGQVLRDFFSTFLF